MASNQSICPLKPLPKPMALRSIEVADAYWAVVEKASRPASSSQVVPAAVDEDPGVYDRTEEAGVEYRLL